MVLQQKATVAIWGKSSSSQVKVHTSWDGRNYAVKVDADGNWKAVLHTPAAGGPFEISLDDGDKTVLSDVLIGEVWIASGQSNMEMPMKGFSDQKISGAEEMVRRSGNSTIRLFKGGRISAGLPQWDLKGKWQLAGEESVREFSAAAYFFADQLQQQLKVPVGIIQCAWGGTTIQSWMSAHALEDFNTIKVPAARDTVFDNKNTPSGLFNGMIHPVTGYGIRGFLWYQGEQNVKEPELYSQLFPALINEWRQLWGNEDLPFYYAQIAPWDYKSLNYKAPLLREVQLQALGKIKNSGIVILTDAGDKKNIHPSNKKIVGERFLKLALAQTYKKNTPFSGPVYRQARIEGNKAYISFDFSDGLYIKGDSINNFEIAGTDKLFHPVKASVQKGQVIAFSDKVAHPVAVRYAFKGWAEGNLFNKYDLPASSFRTDDWEVKNDDVRQWSDEQVDKWFAGNSWNTSLPVKPDSIIDKRLFADQYMLNSKSWDAAYKFIKESDFTTMKPGNYTLSDDGAYANIAEYPTKESSHFEAHRKFIDIQLVSKGKEYVQITPIERAKQQQVKPYEEAKDIEFFDKDSYAQRLLFPGNFVVLFPSNAHKPCMKVDTVETVRKIVIKVPYVER